MEVEKDPEYQKPPRIIEAPPPQNRDKYFKFHEAIGHYKEGCIALRLLIEKFIKKGKLVRFLGDQRGAVANRENHVQEVNYQHPRDHQPREQRKSRSPAGNRRGRDRNPRDDRGRRSKPRREHIIISGFAGGGESRSARKAYARQVKYHELYAIERPIKHSRRDSLVIGFSDEDYACVSLPHTNALVVTLTVANHNIHCLLVDNRSSADILYWSVFKKLNLG